MSGLQKKMFLFLTNKRKEDCTYTARQSAEQDRPQIACLKAFRCKRK